MRIVSHALTDPGAKRTVNEDFQLVDPKLGLHIVCDGVSGEQAGDFASRTCAETIQKVIASRRALLDQYKKERSGGLLSEIAQALQQAIEAASAEVRKLGQADPKKRGMATTAATALIAYDHAILAHVGDSRIYLIRKGRIHQLTDDHTMAAEMKRTGLWTDEKAKRSPYANTLTRAIGMQESVQVDLLQVELTPGDRLLLCSDGLTSYLDPSELLLFTQKSDLTTVPSEMIDLAKNRGGHDNISVITLSVEADMPRSDALDALKKGEVLGRVPLFRYLVYPELIKVLSLVKVRQFRASEQVIQEGTHGDDLFVIAQGELEVVKGGQVVATRKSGEFLGEIGFFNNIPRTATVLAKGASTTLVFSRRELLSLLKKEPSIAVKLLWSMGQELSRRVSQTTQDLAEAKAFKPEGITLPEFELPFVTEKAEK
jgi:serine/threonine protein phosphatase PrpC